MNSTTWLSAASHLNDLYCKSCMVGVILDAAKFEALDAPGFVEQGDARINTAHTR